MADSASDQLLQYRMALGLQKAGARDQAAAQQQASVQQLALQQGGIQGNRQLQGEKGVIDYALQAQSIGGQRQLANDQYGYNYGLQEQQGQQNWDLDHARFQHADELFQREQAGRIAELHLQQMQADKMARFQAQQDQQRLNQQQDFAAYQQQQDFGQANQHLAQQQQFAGDQTVFDAQQQQVHQLAQQTHEVALHKMAMQGQQARDELLQRHRNGELAQEHQWRGEELNREDQQKQKMAIMTHVATMVEKGLGTYDTGAEQKKIQAMDAIRNSPNITPDDKKKKLAEIQQEIEDNIIYSARPFTPAEQAASYKAQVEAFPPEVRPIISRDPKTGKASPNPVLQKDKADALKREQEAGFKREDRLASQQENMQQRKDVAAQHHEEFEFGKKQAEQENQAALKQHHTEFWMARRENHEKERAQAYQSIMKEIEGEINTEDTGKTNWGSKVMRNRTTEEKIAEAKKRVDAILPPDLYGNSPDEFDAKMMGQPPPSNQPGPGQAAPQQAKRKVSPDGKYYWDGSKWQLLQ